MRTWKKVTEHIFYEVIEQLCQLKEEKVERT